jgi:Mce-associated membrane protein
MPPRPRPPRPRATPSRRPRVAGTAPTAPRPDGPGAAVNVDDPLTEPAEATQASPAPAAGRPTGVDSDRAEARNGSAEPRRTPRPRPKAAPVADERPEEGTAGGEPTAPVPVRKARRAQNGAPAAPRPRPAAAGPEQAPVDDAAGDTVADTAGDAEPAPSRDSGFAAALRGRAVPLLLAALVLLTAAAVVFGVQDARLRSTPAATNIALVDVGATAEAAGQLSDAVETVYSFDFARLDENENAAREVITPAFAAEFERLFAEVRARAPEQQAVVSATVTMSAVKELSADRAVLVAFVDQQATRAAPDAQSQQLAAAGRLTVTGEKVDGRWKIATVTPL